eukprot:UN26837
MTAPPILLPQSSTDSTFESSTQPQPPPFRPYRSLSRKSAIIRVKTPKANNNHVTFDTDTPPKRRVSKVL